ncbi:MAG: hypothetical protein GWN14_19125 [candidate division Zixibacteria bacterium]|nr:hypothetical protein [Gammaproteobacteria bacterium]NIX57971.1 hypothetical protein [candidate division Zixibacteria bacterium]
MKPKIPPWLLLSFGLFVMLAALLMIPSTNQAILARLGFEGSSHQAPAYNGFKAFIPFIPGYFPPDFKISHAETSSSTTSRISTYTETYASDQYFFKTIQSQGPSVPDFQADPGFTIQGHPARLTDNIDLAHLFEADSLNLDQFDIHQLWMVNVVLKDITIQVVTNLPRSEAVQVAEGLIPSICTSTPAPEG